MFVVSKMFDVYYSSSIVGGWLDCRCLFSKGFQNIYQFVRFGSWKINLDGFFGRCWWLQIGIDVGILRYWSGISHIDIDTHIL